MSPVTARPTTFEINAQTVQILSDALEAVTGRALPGYLVVMLIRKAAIDRFGSVYRDLPHEEQVKFQQEIALVLSKTLIDSFTAHPKFAEWSAAADALDALVNGAVEGLA